jgi:hypothetical protein
MEQVEGRFINTEYHLEMLTLGPISSIGQRCTEIGEAS